MKKIIAFIFVMVVAFVYSIPCFAENFNHDVSAKYIESSKNCSSGVVMDGKANVTLTNGVSITINGIPSDDYTLFVKEISDTENDAIKWFDECLSGKSKEFYPFDICLFDGNDRVVLTNDVDVQIVFPKTYVDKVFFVDTNSNVLEQNCNYEKNMISFKSKLNAYCLIIPAENQPSSPQTGDNNLLFVWAVVLISSLVILVLLISKKKNHIKINL